MEGISFANAQDHVRVAMEAAWEVDGWGEFYIAPFGSENLTHWLVVFGAREWIVENDVSFMLVGAPITLVSKATGAISRINYLDDMALVDAMTDVGDWPPEEDDDLPAGA